MSSEDRDRAGAADGADAESAGDRPDTDGGHCPACGGALFDRHCKLVCERCGRVVADCSDPFRF